MAAEDRFWAKVEKSADPDGCWLWVGGGTRYGNFWFDGHQVSAHRYAYQTSFGEPPESKPIICHTCDTPKCVNPSHLYAGSQADNISDMISKGRHGREASHGSDSPNAKLHESDVEEIHTLLRQGNTGTEIARMYGVHHTVIYDIKHGKSWTHVDA